MPVWSLVVFGLMPIWSAMAFASNACWSPAPPPGGRPWWPVKMGAGSGVVSFNKLVGGVNRADAVAFFSDPGCHGGGRGAEEGFASPGSVASSSSPTSASGARRPSAPFLGDLLQGIKAGFRRNSLNKLACWLVWLLRLVIWSSGSSTEVPLEQEEDVVLRRLQSWILSLRQLQHLLQARLGCFMIFTAGYEISVISRNMEIIKCASWSVQHDAQTELESMTSMQIAPAAMHIIEQDVPSMFTSTWFFWHDDKHGDDAVPVVRVDPSVVDDNTPAAVPQIQQRGLLRLSSVKDIQYLQLSPPLPQVQMPDRPSGEPPAGHQLVWSIEALEDCICGTFGSELSTDGRSPCGSFCSLRCWHDVLSSPLFGLCFSVWLYLTLFSGAVMYYDR